MVASLVVLALVVGGVVGLLVREADRRAWERAAERAPFDVDVVPRGDQLRVVVNRTAVRVGRRVRVIPGSERLVMTVRAGDPTALSVAMLRARRVAVGMNTERVDF